MMGTRLPPPSCPRLGLAVVVLVLGHVVATSSDLDPYRTLGVTRHAGQAEIKKAYKQLAKEWHPDKNKDPQAANMFIKISKSYEILSNKERRDNYDRFGQTEEGPPRAQHHHGSFHDSFYFDQSFFHFTQSDPDFTDRKHLLSYGQYVDVLLPDSFKKPYLIQITSQWCFACIHIQPVWRQTLQQLEPLGVGFGVVDIRSDVRLVDVLGAPRPPALLGIINGRVFFFYNSVTAENLRQFVESLLPQNLVQKVTDENSEAFLNGWRDENKPSMLLFDSASSPSLLYKLTAFAYRDFVRFGLVGHGEGPLLTRRFKIQLYAPTMLLFKENTERPADSLQSKGIKRPTLEEFVSQNRFLLVPRLVNQKLFDELCPIKRPQKYCVLLITGEEEDFNPVTSAFFDFASSDIKEELRFTYVYHKQQWAFCDALLQGGTKRPPQVVILKRTSFTGRVPYHPVGGGWNGSDENKTLLREHLVLLHTLPNFFTHEATLPELNDELAPMFLVRWVNLVCDYLSQVYFNLLLSNWTGMMPLLTLICPALVLLFGSVLMQAFSDPTEKKPGQRRTNRAPPQTSGGTTYGEHSSRGQSKKVGELTYETYSSDVVNLKPGRLNVVLLLTDASKHVLLQRFQEEVGLFLGSENLQFSFLDTSKHTDWMDSLLQMAPDPGLSDLKQEEGASFCGHVLALNGHRKYFCLFTPPYKGSDPHSVTQQLHHTLDHLDLWMEKLTGGTLQRHYVEAWPYLDS